MNRTLQSNTVVFMNRTMLEQCDNVHKQYNVVHLAVEHERGNVNVFDFDEVFERVTAHRVLARRNQYPDPYATCQKKKNSKKVSKNTYAMSATIIHTVSAKFAHTVPAKLPLSCRQRLSLNG